VPEVPPSGMVRLAGTVAAAGLELERVTTVPLGRAGRLRVTVAVKVPPGSTVAGSRVRAVGSLPQSRPPRQRVSRVTDLVRNPSPAPYHAARSAATSRGRQGVKAMSFQAPVRVISPSLVSTLITLRGVIFLRSSWIEVPNDAPDRLVLILTRGSTLAGLLGPTLSSRLQQDRLERIHRLL
jgi:hypothetical protein